MESYKSILNYILFVILYVTCFIFMYNKNSEIIGIVALTVIQLGFTLFIGNEISELLNNQSLFAYSNLLNLYTSLISMILLSVSLILTTITLIDIQEKSNDTKGTPIILSSQYQVIFDSIKEKAVIILLLLSLSLFIYYNYSIDIKIPISNIFSNTPLTIITVLNIIIISLSSYQIYNSNKFSKLKTRTLIGR